MKVLWALVALLVAGCASPADTQAPDGRDAVAPDGMAGDPGSPTDRDGAQPADPTRTNGSGPDGAPGGPSADATPAWADLASAAIHPGMQTFTDGSQCTANFVFYAVNGTGFDIFVGQAAHCSGTGASTDTNGCTAGTLPLGTKVDLGTGNDGTIVYSSWIAMQEAKAAAGAPECVGNDFALIQVAEEDEAKVSPEVPFFGGPVAVGPSTLGTGEAVYSYGNSGLRLGVEPVLSWKHGNVVYADAWTIDVYTATPGVPGDSGSGFLDAEGRAIGVLSTVAVLPLPLSNQVSGLESALAYMEAHGGPDARLGTAPWGGGLA